MKIKIYSETKGQTIKFQRQIALDFQQCILKKMKNIHQKSTSDSIRQSKNSEFQKSLRANDDEQIPQTVVYTGNISDFWMWFSNKRIHCYQKYFEENDYEVLKESIDSARLYFLLMTIQSFQEKSELKLKKQLQDQYVQLKMERKKELLYDREDVKKTDFFKRFIQKNQILKNDQDQIIRMVYQSQFPQQNRNKLNRYFVLVIQYLRKKILKNTNEQRDTYELIYILSILQYSIYYPSYSQVALSPIHISEMKFNLINKKVGLIMLIREINQMKSENLINQVKKLQKCF